jgi:hypothetical protein
MLIGTCLGSSAPSPLRCIALTAIAARVGELRAKIPGKEDMKNYRCAFASLAAIPEEKTILRGKFSFSFGQL